MFNIYLRGTLISNSLKASADSIHIFSIKVIDEKLFRLMALDSTTQY